MSRIWLWRACVVGVALALPVAGAMAQVDGSGAATGAAAVPQIATMAGGSNIYDASVAALTKLAMIAVILEQALALIFDWKPFRETFDRSAVKPIVSFLFAGAIVHEFGLDVVATLIKAYGGDQDGIGVVSKLVTALVLAGGSGGINRILQRMGVRSNLNLKDDNAPPPTMAFVSVVPMPKSVKCDIACVTVVGIDSTGSSHSLGTVAGPSVGRDPTGWRAFFLQEKGRFPTDGGFALTPGQWSIRLDATDSAGTVSSSTIWGPYQLDAGAQIDLTIKV